MISKSKTNIWVLKEMVTDSQFIFSGDSDGRVGIWNRKSGICLKTIEELQADVTTLCVSKDTIFASGVDSKIISMRLVKEEGIVGRTEAPKSWIYAGNIRGQSHDIKSICLIND